jgi:hypothetical protein
VLHPTTTAINTPRHPNHIDVRNAGLAEIRRLAAREELGPEDAAYLAELVEALDEWISKGGILPRSWAHAHGPA